MRELLNSADYGSRLLNGPGSLGRRCGRGLWAEVGWAAAKLIHTAAIRTNLYMPKSLV